MGSSPLLSAMLLVFSWNIGACCSEAGSGGLQLGLAHRRRRALNR